MDKEKNKRYNSSNRLRKPLLERQAKLFEDFPQIIENKDQMSFMPILIGQWLKGPAGNWERKIVCNILYPEIPVEVN